MLSKIFLTIVNMSIMASLVIGLVLVGRLILIKAPRIFSYTLWGVVLFRILCPLSIKSDLSFLNYLSLPRLESKEISNIASFVIHQSFDDIQT